MNNKHTNEKLLEACRSALKALRGAVTNHGRMCGIEWGTGCDCWLPLRRRAIEQLELAIELAEQPAESEGE